MGIKGPTGSDSPHLSDGQLARLEDGELSAREASHLQSCPQCGSRLGDAQAARAAYVEYRDAIRAPLLAPPPKPWQPLDALIARHEASCPRGLHWWSVASLGAAACLMLGLIVTALVLWSPKQTASLRANQLLTKSAKLDLPPRRSISLRVHGRTMVRPAVLSTEASLQGDSDIARFQMVFAAAHYSWREPLSARSFQAWRSGLRDKRDSVSIIRAQDDESYRVRTETDSGVLRSASLTLRAPDLRPVAGAFDFEREGTVELAEAAASSEHASEARAQPARPFTAPAHNETPAGPEVTLHVLAALNQIGADVGEPVEISEDPRHQHVVVHAAGVSRERQRQIAGVLKAVPRVMLEFDSGRSPLPPAKATPLERYSASIPATLRQQFEERLGGPAAFQVAIDGVLEASASDVAQAHALEILARDFGPRIEASLMAQDREILHKLRDNHISELERLVSRIREDFKPLLPGIPDGAVAQAANGGATASWQAGAASLVALARKTDDSLNRLLASSYSQSSGEEMLRTLAAQIEQFDSAIRSERQAGR
jgi:hypothetical protein